MNIYVLRHGQTKFNVEGKFQGRIDTKLSKKGLEQANYIKEKLKDIKFDTVISSPLSRARQTANIVANMNILVDDRIIERSFGNLEGKYVVKDFESKPKIYNIETYEDLCKRTYNFLDDIINKYKGMENILVVTHEGIAQIIETYFNKQQNKTNWKQFRLQTGNYKKYEVTESEYKAIRTN